MVSVNQQPSVTVTPSALALCTSGGTETLTSSVSGGAGTAVYTWSGPGITGSTATGATTSYSLVPAPGTSSGAYSLSVSYSGTGCNNATATTSTVNIGAQPTVSVAASAIGNICAGIPEILTTSPSNGAGTASYTWSGPGISGTAGPYASPTYTVVPVGGSSAGVYSVVLSFSGVGCNITSNTTAAVSVVANQWGGAASTSWSNTGNWTCGIVPTATQDVVIPGAISYTNAPTLDVSAGYSRNLTVNATAILTLGSGNQLDVNDTFNNNGTIGGGGAVYLDGSALQILKGQGTVANLTLNNVTGAQINTTGDTVGVTGEVLLSAGTLTTNGTLMLLSDSCVVCSNSDSLINGYIGPIASGAGISGQVVVQQFVPRGTRAYRFIAHPFTSSVPLSQIEPFVDITGPGGSSNGFTTTITNAASAFWYNPLDGNSVVGNDPGWRSFKNTYAATGSDDTDQINQYEGLRLFVRGSKGQGLDGLTYSPNPVTYRTYGTVNTGTLYEPMVMGTASVAGTPCQRYNLLGNPYPAVTDRVGNQCC